MAENIESIVRTALTLSGPERDAYIEKVCGGDAELKAKVEASVAAGEASDTVDLPPPPAPARAIERDIDLTASQSGEDFEHLAESVEYPGQEIGNYRLVSLLGEGGFGTVWLADQLRPVQRRVALKIIKLGMDTRRVIGRFEAERQALAVMDHPNIAKVFDAGSTETGRPYFVMEYADGVPFTTYCDDHNLSVRERLRLFQRVCSAVQHAHQKGIIHRDLKPSNVLVTEQEGEASPKVIDFGIAKATEAKSASQTMFTSEGQVIGTPAYMSPEQAGLTGDDIDTRSDVYSLGVLLYEAMTGETPFNPRTLLEIGFDEIKRVIREVDPPRPSTRVSKVGEQISTIASVRGTDPKRLGVTLHGDVDWIVMKAIEKDRRRRYQTPDGIAEDIERFLTSQPVLASPPSRVYRFKKFVQRRKGSVIAASLLLAALVAGTVGTSVGFVRATHAAEVADTQAEIARTERDKAEQTVVFLTEMLGGVGAQVAQGADTELLRSILDKTSQRVGEELGDQPLVEASIRSQIGSTYAEIRAFDAAEENMERAYELYRAAHPGDHENVAQSLSNLGLLRNFENRNEESEEFLRENLAMRQRLHSEDAPELAWAMTNLGNTLVRLERYEEAEALLEDALAMFRRVHGDGHEDVGVLINSLANLMQHLDEYERAEEYYLEALQIHKDTLGEEHPFVATDLVNLAMMYQAVGQTDKAIALFDESLAMHRRLFPDGHEGTARCLVNLGLLLRYDDERSGEAVGMLEEALALQKRLFGDVDSDVQTTLYQLGRVLASQRRYEEALVPLRENVRVAEALDGRAHNNSAVAYQALGRCLADLRRFDEASETYDQALEIQHATFGDAHPEIAITMVNIAAMHQRAESYDEAERYLVEAIEQFKASGNERSPNIAACYERMGQIATARSDYERAAETLRLALEIRIEDSGINSRNALGAAYALSDPLITIGAYEEAEDLLQRCMRDEAGQIDPRTDAHIKMRYAKLLEATGRLVECAATLEACYGVFSESDGPESGIAQKAVSERVRIGELIAAGDPESPVSGENELWRSRLAAPDGEEG